MFSPFGFYLLLAFTSAYFAFRSEYKRKEAEGLIHAFSRTVHKTHSITWALGGFLVGAKLVYWWQYRSMYIGTPQEYIFSSRGSLAGGLATGLATWLVVRRLRTAVPGHAEQAPAAGASELIHPARQPTTELIHPYQLMDTLLFYCGIFGFAGALFFSRFESPASWEHISFGNLFTFSGFNYYGALIAGALTYLHINRRYGIRPAIAADIGSPGMMLAYAIGRIGCHVAGDGDWGIVNEKPLPSWLRWLPEWLWADRYPHNSVHQGIYIPGCTGNNCTVLPTPVYPTPLYEATICLCLFFLLWSLRRKIKRPGLLFAFFAILNGAERFTIEFIRINPRYSIGSWNLSQAQFLALGWILTGLTVLIFTTRKNDGLS